MKLSIEKFYKYATRMDHDTFEKFLMINKILNWKEGFTFTEDIITKTGKSVYWWKHKDGAKSGETYETMEEAELSALICFTKKHK